MAGMFGLGRDLMATARSAPYLERDEEHALAVRWHDQADQQALHRLVAAHMRLVISTGARFRGFGLPLGDIVQEGHVGLLEAATRFDPWRGVRFSTYAAWWIRAAIQDYLLRNWSIVRGGTSSSQKALFFNLRRLRARLRQEGDGDADRHRRIAAAVGVSAADAELMDARLSAPDLSLNAPLSDDGEGGPDYQDRLAGDLPLPEEIVTHAIDDARRHDWLTRALGVLSEREFAIVRARRLSESGATLESLGRALGISKERVRQIENRALDKLRAALLTAQPDRTAFI